MIETSEVRLLPEDHKRLANLCGPLNEHIHQLERSLGVQISNRGNQFRLTGTRQALARASDVLRRLYKTTEKQQLSVAEVHLQLGDVPPVAPAQNPVNVAEETAMPTTENDSNPQAKGQPEDQPEGLVQAGFTRMHVDDMEICTKRGQIRPRGDNQRDYLQRILDYDISFGIGPAGTGKTYLAVACAVHALERDMVRKLVLVRPAVEAGERLGFLPGDLAQKIDPYLRPLYDALYEMLGFEKVERLQERNIIEVAPLAYMRGRTLNEAFVILDEAQNTTPEQMKMFLTRIGFGSKAVVTGDLTQVDLPHSTESGLRHATRILENVKGLSITRFQHKDVVRHKLVQRIVRAYDAADEANGTDGQR